MLRLVTLYAILESVTSEDIQDLIKFRGKPRQQDMPRVNGLPVHSHRLGLRLAAISNGPGRQQRVAFKSSYVSPSKLRRHITYLGRDSAGADGKKPEVFTEQGKEVPSQPMDNERRIYRFILSPENGDRLDMKQFTREFMEQYEEASGKNLHWFAAVHYNTAHPHAHIVVRGVNQEGERFFLSKGLLNTQARELACELATHHLLLRTDREIAAQLSRDLVSTRFTGIDRSIHSNLERSGFFIPLTVVQQKRLEFLERELNLAHRTSSKTFQLDPKWKQTLEYNGRQHDIIHTIESDLPPYLKKVWKDQSSAKPLYIYRDSWTIQGKVFSNGIDEGKDRPFGVIEAKNAFYYFSSSRSELAHFKVGSEVKLERGKLSSLTAQHIRGATLENETSSDQGNMPSLGKKSTTHDQGIER